MVEILPLPLRNKFPAKEKEILEDSGVTFYMLRGKTIKSQIRERERAGLPSFWDIYLICGGKEDIISLSSRRIEIGIFTDPNDFFVPNSFGENIKTIEELVRVDAANLCARLNLKSTTLIVANKAAILTELAFQHHDATGQWLYDPMYAAQQKLDRVYGITSNVTVTGQGGSRIAIVGHANPDPDHIGLHLNDCSSAQKYCAGAPRLLVATRG